MPYVVTCLKHQKIFNIYNLKCMMMYQLSSLKSEFVDKISISVEDLQTPSLPLIYQTEFSDNHLRIGDNILSQNWRQKKLSANFFRDKNAFGYIYVFIQHIYTHSVLFKWIISKLISVDLVASYFHTNFHFFFDKWLQKYHDILSYIIFSLWSSQVLSLDIKYLAFIPIFLDPRVYLLKQLHFTIW